MSLTNSEWRVLRLMDLSSVYVVGPAAGGLIRIGVGAHPWEAVQRLRKTDPTTIMHHLTFAADKGVALRLKRETLARFNPSSRTSGDVCAVEPEAAIQAMREAAKRIGGGIWREEQVRPLLAKLLEKRVGRSISDPHHKEYARREAMSALTGLTFSP